MGKRKDLSEFDKGQIVMARRLGQSISKTAALVGCSWSAVVSIYQKWSKEGTVVNRRQGHGRPRLIDARGERRLVRVVRSNRRATVAQIAQEVNAGSDRKVSEYTVHHGLLPMGLHSHTAESTNSEHVSIRTGPRSNGKSWPGLMVLHHMDGRVHVRRLPGKHMAPGCTMGRRQAGGGSVMLWAMFCWETLGPATHVDVTLTRTIYLSIVEDYFFINIYSVI
ncbi:hypothetical protein DPX16_15895 [Anabarilius grahami]|uniref:Transposase Tc1-like domain-containing protein n=1 Tax=Anabarilius grahami TaxID=495550 RepID=A0A3N0YTP8_ANAGA|nr:hypothetical protein DPX16_15895 [Anabarilius grahami]